MSSNNAGGHDFENKDRQIDPNVYAQLPKRCKVLGTKPHGVSFWAKTGRITVELHDSTQTLFFLKTICGEHGRNMMHSELESMKAVHKLLPDFTPKPVAWGSYATDTNTHFLLCEFREMTEDMPDPHGFTAQLAALHSNSESPNGKFGFHIPTYSGNLPQYTDWESSWETFFSKSLRKALDMEIEARGYDPEFDELVPKVFDAMIPRLLRPLETEGRSVKPSLVHGDLWCANSGIDVHTKNALVFDACCFYAHNEYEFGQWRPACNKFGDEYLTAYHTYVPISPLEEDYLGRLDLYKLRFNTHVSALFVESETLRVQILGDMRDLVQRYGGVNNQMPNTAAKA